MKRIIRNTLLLLAICPALFAKPETSESVHIQKDLLFATTPEKELLLDLYLPIGTENPFLVVYIHGGAWSGGSKDGCSISWLAEYGYAVASISYRFSQEAVFPAQIHDVKAAVRWLRANAEAYGYRADQIAVAGSSAGGQLAALLGTSGGVRGLEGTVGDHLDQSSRVNVVINYFGASDFVLRSKTQPARANNVNSVVYNYLGGPASVLTEQAVLASPAFYVDGGDPPALILHGVRDDTVLIDQGLRLFTCYLESGLPVEFHAVDSYWHGDARFYKKPYRQIVVKFLERYLLK